MAQPAQRDPPMTVEAFLAWEELQALRHEFGGGDVVAMVEATAAHNIIIQNAAGAIRGGLKAQGSRCGTFTENMKVITPSGDVAYPDVVVACGAWSLKDSVAPEPVVIIEVLSETTERADRGRKWLAYQSIPSLRHYVLLAQDVPSAEVYSRDEVDGWRYAHVEGLETTVELEAFGLVLSLEALFRDALAVG